MQIKEEHFAKSNNAKVKINFSADSTCNERPQKPIR